MQLQRTQQENREFFGSGYIENDFVCKRENGVPFIPNYITIRFRKILQNHGMRRIRFRRYSHKETCPKHTATCPPQYCKKQHRQSIMHCRCQFMLIFSSENSSQCSAQLCPPCSASRIRPKSTSIPFELSKLILLGMPLSNSSIFTCSSMLFINRVRPDSMRTNAAL